MVRKESDALGRDIGTIVLSVFVAIFITESGIINHVLASAESHIIGSFIAGIFFTSVFTTVPAIVVLVEIIEMNSIFIVALFGAIGALLGDFIIFRFVRDTLTENLMKFIKEGHHTKLRALFYSRAYKRLLPFIGALIIASPLPDELGLVMLGAAGVKTRYFLILSFALNFAGLVAIGFITKAII